MIILIYTALFHHVPKQISLFFLIRKWNLALLDVRPSKPLCCARFFLACRKLKSICQILWLSSVFRLELPGLQLLSVPSALPSLIPCLNYSSSVYLWLVFKNSQPLCLRIFLPILFCPVIITRYFLHLVITFWQSHFKVCIQVTLMYLFLVPVFLCAFGHLDVLLIF